MKIPSRCTEVTQLLQRTVKRSVGLSVTRAKNRDDLNKKNVTCMYCHSSETSSRLSIVLRDYLISGIARKKRGDAKG